MRDFGSSFVRVCLWKIFFSWYVMCCVSVVIACRKSERETQTRQKSLTLIPYSLFEVTLGYFGLVQCFTEEEKNYPL